MLQIKSKKCGIYIHPALPFLASSPDRIISLNGETVLVEVKCPFSSKDQDISAKTVPYLQEEENGKLSLKENHQYFFQIQGQMACSGLNRCIFVVHTFKDTKIMEIKKNDAFIQNMEEKLTQFFNNYFKIGLLDMFLYKKF